MQHEEENKKKHKREQMMITSEKALLSCFSDVIFQLIKIEI
jgi:hypothetical protein